jgi:membrane protease YdiL (CAAX protease family)
MNTTHGPIQAIPRGVTGSRLLAAIAISAVLAVAAGFATAYGLPRIAPSWDDTNRLAAVIVLEVYVAIVVGHGLAFGGLRGLSHALCIRSTTAGQVAAALSVWVAMWGAAAVLYFVLSPIVWPLSTVRSALLWVGADGGRLAHADPILFTLAAGRAVVVAPLAEEMLFRGSLFGWLRRLLPAWTTILLTAALFAIAHPMPVLWPATLLFGVGAAWFRERSDSLTPFIIVHMVNSIALFAVSYWITAWNVPNLLASR